MLIEVLVLVGTLKSGLTLSMASVAPTAKLCEEVRPLVEAQFIREHKGAVNVQSICLQFEAHKIASSNPARPITQNGVATWL